METKETESPPGRRGVFRGFIHEKKPCQYCGQPLSVNALQRHELICKDATPGQREMRLNARESARKKPDRQREREYNNKRRYQQAAVMAKASLNGRGPYQHSEAFHEKQQQREQPPAPRSKVSLTISVDLETLMKLLKQLGPEGFSLDGIKLS